MRHGNSRKGGQSTRSCWRVAREASGYLDRSSAPTRWMKASLGTSNCGAIEVKRGFFARDRKMRAKGGIAGYLFKMSTVIKPTFSVFLLFFGWDPSLPSSSFPPDAAADSGNRAVIAFTKLSPISSACPNSFSVHSATLQPCVTRPSPSPNPGCSASTTNFPDSIDRK